MREALDLKARHGQSGRPFVHVKTGDDLFRKTGKWNKLNRRVDRDKDWYDEKIMDPETGKILHEVHEPLSQRRGRGSARKAKPRD